MKKVFLYLYPIKEFTNMFLLSDDSLYDKWNIERPLPILNKAIDERYRKNGYQIVYVLFPDRELYGLEKMDEDKIIYTDISFSDFSAYDEFGNKKENFIPKYPSEELIIEQLGNIDELIVGGYHALDCVKRVGEVSLQKKINTLVDLDLTDYFFNLYKQKDYFNIEQYDPNRFKENVINKYGDELKDMEERIFNNNYSSPVYGFNTKSYRR